MAKITLSPLLVARIDGPAGNARWRTTHDGQVLVTAEGQHRAPRKTPPLDTTQPGMRYRTTKRIDCTAWKIADRTYSINRKDFSKPWRSIITKPNTSPYDAYMHYAVPYLLHGLSFPGTPPATYRHGMPDIHAHPTDLLGQPVTDLTWAVPPDDYRTRGLSACACIIAHAGPYTITYVYTHTHVGLPDQPWAGFAYVATLEPGADTPTGPIFGWKVIRTIDMYATFRVGYFDRVDIQWYPAQRYTDGTLIEPWTIENTEPYTVGHLASGQVWRIPWLPNGTPFKSPFL